MQQRKITNHSIGMIDNASLDRLISRLETATHVDEDGIEYWYASDLQRFLGYTRWEQFFKVVKKAITACQNSGQQVEQHFVEIQILPPTEEKQQLQDMKLTRYACYLIVQNADSRKKSVAFAQAYFAIQTRGQELNDRAQVPAGREAKRVYLREELKKHNKDLARTAGTDPSQNSIEYAQFQNAGYQDLYNGLDKKSIQAYKSLRPNRDILDYMSSEELAANLFCATQTEAKLKRKYIQGKEAANQAHYDVGKKVRSAIQELGGTMPEVLPTEENIKKVTSRLKEQKALHKAVNIHSNIIDKDT